MQHTHYDVIIIGGGPAGVAAAIRLTQLQFSVCIIDKPSNSKLKVGESIPGATLRLLAVLGINSLETLLALNNFKTATANVSAWGTENWSYTNAIQNPEGGGWHLLRHKFDTALQEYALQQGITFINNLVKNVHKEKQYSIQLKFPHEITKLTSNFIIDASGRAAVFLKQLGIPKITFEEQMAAYTWLKPNKNDTDATTRIKSVKNGWWYTSLLPDNSRIISFHGLINDVQLKVKNSNVFIEEFNDAQLLPYSIYQKDFITTINAKQASITHANKFIGTTWLAVGDAALSFDPIASQGIFFALYSGITAAETLQQLVKSPKDSTTIKATYTEKIQRVFKHNKNTRTMFYTMEQRYTKQPYWQQYYR